MPFPYTVPIKKWIKDILIEREKSPNIIGLRMPFVTLTSSAIILKGNVYDSNEKRLEALGDILENGSMASSVYKGCVISNRTDIPSIYQLNETIIGYDLTGKAIKVEGEKNRRISTPIIENVEIDTDGGNNTLKTATISIKCFSLKQLEMFELFFLKPTLTLLLEFGDSSLLRNSTLPKPETALIPKNNFEEFVEELSKFLVANNETIGEYYKKSKNSKGSYDFVVGKVTGYTYSIDDSGIYTISLEISAGNQFTLAIPVKTSTAIVKGSTPQQNSPTLYEQTIAQMASDFDIDFDKFKAMLEDTTQLPVGKTDWKNDFFNFGKLNVKQEDETVSINAYVSLRFILKILMNYSSKGNDEFQFPIPEHRVNGKLTEYIPAQSHKNLLSSSELILFPGKIPTITTGSGADFRDIVFDTKKLQDCTINGYSYNENAKIYRFDEENKEIEIKPLDQYTIGNLLNCFILYEELVQIWRKSFTRLDFIEQILRLINQNTYGITELRTASDKENKKITIIDFKLETKIKPNSDEVYRFKPGTINSILRNFSFNMELSDIIAARSAFGSQRFFSDAIIKKELNKSDARSIEVILNEKVLQSVDMQQYTSYDGYFTVDMIAYKAAKKSVEKLKSQYKTTGVVQTSTSNKESDDVTKEIAYDKLVKSKLKIFKVKNEDKGMPLIFLNSSPIKHAIGIDVTKNTIAKPTLSPIEITLTIDGISGFSCGEYFHIDGVPETYNRDGAFEITNIKHSINTDGWFTTLEARFRFIDKTK